MSNYSYVKLEVDILKLEIVLEGIHCASCAAKIESEVSSLKGVETASVNMVNGNLNLEADEDIDIRSTVISIEKIVDRIEPGVKVIHNYTEGGDKPRNQEEDDREGREELYRILFGAALFAASFFIDSGNVKTGLLTLSYLFAGSDIVLRSFKNILKGDVFDENFLMSLATFGAIMIGEYSEAVAVMLFYQVGEMFQERAVNKSRKSIKSLLDIRPDYANIVKDGVAERVSPEEVRIGDVILVKPGEKIPLDGVVVSGESRANTSALTGEPVPRSLKVGDEALSGFVNETGLIEIEVKKLFGESTVSRILDLVQNASGKKAPTENFITKFAKYYTPVVVGLAAVIAIGVPIFTGGDFSTWIYRALVFLVISCPCALVVSIPLGFFGGIGASSKSGILVKGGNYLEALNDVEYVVMDKTGTLTKGVFEVQNVISYGGYSETEVLEYAAIAEAHTTHPIGKSIVDKYGKAPDEKRIGRYEEISGHGIIAEIDGKTIVVGNEKHLRTEGIEFSEDNSGTVVLVGIDGDYAGKIEIADEIKEDAAESIKELKKLGIKEITMLTGDSEDTASKISGELGLDRYFAKLLPEDKLEKLEMIEAEKGRSGKLVFVGDGINDAPVLARADIGIAMGGLGSDAAIEASDIVIMTDEPSKIATAIKIARRTKKIVLQNIVFALGVKLLVLGLGALGFATMWEAVFADVGVSLIAVLNAMRALRVK